VLTTHLSRNFYSEGRQASYVRARKSPGAVLDFLELARPGGDMGSPAVPELVLVQDMLGGQAYPAATREAGIST
jgi:AraC family transcriptional regulator